MTRKKPGVIGILTGGGDVPGLNPAIRAVTIRAIREGYKVIGLRRGWAGVTEIIREKDADTTTKYYLKKSSLAPGALAVRSCILRAPNRA
jgi:6-phosphofructokinase